MYYYRNTYFCIQDSKNYKNHDAHNVNKHTYFIADLLVYNPTFVM